MESRKFHGGVHIEHRADPERGRYLITRRNGRKLEWADTLNINGDRPFAFGDGATVEFGSPVGGKIELVIDSPRGKNDGNHVQINL